MGQTAFERTAQVRIGRLRDSLADGTYRPGPLRRVAIPKRQGGERILAIPCIADRVVQTAVAQLIGPTLDRTFEPTSFAYRPGRGVAAAVQTVLRHRRDGFRWTAEGDVAHCFDEIPHDQLLARLEAEIPDARLVDLVALWLASYAPRGIGIPQGAPISPLLCNLHLDAVDEAVAGHGIRLVRYADDFVILAKSEPAARAGLERISAVLRLHGLDLNPDKTRILGIDQALRFLGHIFVRSMAWQEAGLEADADGLEDLPPPPDAPTEELLSVWSGAVEAGTGSSPDQLVAPETTAAARARRVLHLVEPGARLGVQHQSFHVAAPAARDEPPKGRLLEHARRIDRIEIGAGASASWDALALAASHDIPVAMVDGFGQTVGWFTGPADSHGGRMLAQARYLADPERQRALAVTIVRARIRSQYKRIAKLNLTRKNPDLAALSVQLRRDAGRLAPGSGIEQAMGHEGAAAARYLSGLAACIPVEFGWDGLRRRRPPPDPVNAVLGMLYGLLAREVAVAIGRAGLHPGMGALHASREGRDALVYDLMEVFRAPVAERLLTDLVARKAIVPEMFVVRGEAIEDGSTRVYCRIEQPARRAIIRAHEALMVQPVASRRTGIQPQPRIPWRSLIEEEARALSDLFGGHEAAFEPYEADY